MSIAKGKSVTLLKALPTVHFQPAIHDLRHLVMITYVLTDDSAILKQ
ncbi:MAG: hypothetical protein IMF14_03910 [Proteobacteria bacterium]|nr:hypothetical protein [Pseudomonadota bacterium]